MLRGALQVTRHYCPGPGDGCLGKTGGTPPRRSDICAAVSKEGEGGDSLTGKKGKTVQAMYFQ